MRSSWPRFGGKKMGKLWDFFFGNPRVQSEDVARVQRVMTLSHRSEMAALKALEIQLRVAETVRQSRGTRHGR